MGIGDLDRATKSRLRDEERRSARVALPDWEPWQADSDPQRMLMNTPAQVIGYGGAVGGGKTAGILIKAATQHRRSLIVRLEYPRLKDVIGRSQLMLSGSGARYNDNEKCWRDVPGGRFIEFGHCQYEKDKERYRGQEHDLKAFDEVTEIPRSRVDFIAGWNRSTIHDQPCQVLMTFNPPMDREGRWVVKYFGPWIDPEYKGNRAEPGELRWFITDTGDDGSAIDVEVVPELFIRLPDGTEIDVDSPDRREINGKVYTPIAREVEFAGKNGEIQKLSPQSRTFIKATLDDNRSLRDSNYRGVIQRFPEPMRSILLKGEFAIEARDNAFQVVPGAHVKLARKRWTREIPLEKRQTRVAADLSWGGADKCAITALYENYVSEFTTLAAEDLKESETIVRSDVIAGAIARLREGDDVEVVLDLGGVGVGPYDSCKRLGLRPIGVYFGGAAKDGRGERTTDRTGSIIFKNKRAEMYWTLREALDPVHGIPGFAIPDDEELEEEICAHRWEATSKIGDRVEIAIASKDEVRELIGRSPDKADALVLLLARNVGKGFDWSRLIRK